MAINDCYALPEGELVGVLRQYLDRIGLAEDAYALLRNFLEARVLTERADGSICFRYRAFLEYFIASQMDISPDFRSWVLDDSRYLSFRSEEHTSELQSLMCISYAASCLKKQHTATQY